MYNISSGSSVKQRNRSTSRSVRPSRSCSPYAGHRSSRPTRTPPRRSPPRPVALPSTSTSNESSNSSSDTPSIVIAPVPEVEEEEVPLFMVSPTHSSDNESRNPVRRGMPDLSSYSLAVSRPMKNGDSTDQDQSPLYTPNLSERDYSFVQQSPPIGPIDYFIDPQVPLTDDELLAASKKQNQLEFRDSRFPYCASSAPSSSRSAGESSTNCRDGDGPTDADMQLLHHLTDKLALTETQDKAVTSELLDPSAATKTRWVRRPRRRNPEDDDSDYQPSSGEDSSSSEEYRPRSRKRRHREEDELFDHVGQRGVQRRVLGIKNTCIYFPKDADAMDIEMGSMEVDEDYGDEYFAVEETPFMSQIRGEFPAAWALFAIINTERASLGKTPF